MGWRIVSLMGVMGAAEPGAAERRDRKGEKGARAGTRSGGAQNSDGCGGAREANGELVCSSSARSLRCARMRSISPGSSMLAITSSRPPHRRHCSMSMAKTRLSLRA